MHLKTVRIIFTSINENIFFHFASFPFSPALSFQREIMLIARINMTLCTVYSATRLTMATQQTFTFEITCKYVNSNNSFNGVQLTTVRTLQVGGTDNQIRTS